MAAAVPRSSRPFFSRRFLLPDAPDAGQHRVRDFCSGDRKRIGGSGPQAADTPREKCCRFDGDASGRRIYAYADNDPIDYVDPLGEDVTVTLYQGAGPYGHIGIGVAPPGFPVPAGQTFGFYPASANVGALFFGTAGVLRQDTGKVPISSVTIPTTPAQDAAVNNYLINAYLNPGNYSLAGANGGNNCATSVQGALGAAGISTGTTPTIIPRDLMQGLQTLYGSGP